MASMTAFAATLLTVTLQEMSLPNHIVPIEKSVTMSLKELSLSVQW